MKKIILLFVALFITISAVNAATDPGTALNNGVEENTLLDTLMHEGMSLNEAVDAILAAGGNRDETLVAAVMVDSDFSMTQVLNNPIGGFDPAPEGAAGAGGGDLGGNDLGGGDLGGGDLGDDGFGDLIEDLAVNEEADDRINTSP